MGSIPQRSGSLSRLYAYEETTFGADPGSPVGWVLPLAGQSNVKSSQQLIEAPFFNGLRLPFGAVAGQIDVSGRVSLEVEFTTIGRLLKAFLGASGYVRPAGGTDTLHEFFVPTTVGATPGSLQLQNESLETTAQYIRWRGVRVGSLGFSYNTEGIARYEAGFMGSGDEVTTDLAGTKTDNGYSAVSYFNGYFNYGGASGSSGTALQGLSEFQLDLETGLSRTNVAFNGGIAGSVVAGPVQATGHLAMLFSTDGSNPENNLNFYNDAVNQTSKMMDCAWSNLPPASATQWMRVVLGSNKFGRSSFMPGGPQGLIVSQGYRAVNDTSAKTYPETWGRTLGPYAITTGVNDKFPIKADGGAAVTTTLSPGGARTAAQIVAELNAAGPFNAIAVAEVFMGRVMTRLKLSGSTHSIQFDTGVAQNCSATLGFNNIVYTGRDNCPILIQLYNAKQTDY